MKTKYYVLGILSILLIAGCGQADPTPTPTAEVMQEMAVIAPTETVASTETVAPTDIDPAPTETVIPKPVPFASFFEEASCPFALPPEEVEGETITCGYVHVPEDRSSSDDTTIRLAVVVFNARSADPQPDPVILLAGGPGERTVKSALDVALLLNLFRDDRDLILFDQRGVGLSEPALECPEFSAAILDMLDELDPETMQRIIYDALMVCRDRFVAEGTNLSAYSTIENAADVDAIRQALGYDQLNIYGGSYGSLLAQAVMREWPEGIRSVTMGAVLPLDKSFFVHVPTTVVNATLHLLEECAADDVCDSAYPDLQKTLYSTIDQLNTNPVPITVTNPLDGQSYDSWLTGDDIFNNLATFLYITDIIPVLPKAIQDVAEGDYQLMTQLSSTKLVLLDALSRGMMFSVFCAQDLIGVTPADFLAVREQIPPPLAGRVDPEDIIEYGFFSICQEWPVDELDPAFKQPVVSDIPTLILEGEFDPVTPLVYAEEVAQGLSSSYLYEFPAVGHNVLVSSRCAQEIADQFMDDPESEPDTSCLAEMPPVAFDLPQPEAGELSLEPVVDAASGLSGVAPVGWENPSPGTYVRAQNSLDPTALIIDVLPMNLTDFLDLITARLSLDEHPVIAGEYITGSFTWTLFAEEVQGVAVDLAVAVLDEETTLMVLLQQPVEERDSLYQALFLPVVDALEMDS